MPRGGLCPWPTFHDWVTMVRKKWLSLYYSTYWCYIHQTYGPTVHLDMIYWCHMVVLCPWPTFHAWVTMVRKKWLVHYYSTYECYIHQTCTNCSSWHDLLMQCGGLCPWPIYTLQWPRHKMAIAGPLWWLYNNLWIFLLSATCLNMACFYGPGPKGPPGASSNRIVRLSVCP